MRPSYVLALSVFLGGCGCGSKSPVASDGDGTPVVDDGGTEPPPVPIPESCNGGEIVYGAGGALYRTKLDNGIETENLTEALNAISSGGDSWVATSSNGEWLVLETERFDSECSGWSCLAIVKGDISEGEAVKIGGNVIHLDDYSAVSNDGSTIVYPFGGGPHPKDLFATKKGRGGWGTATVLTGDSPYPYNLQPRLNGDGSKVVFDCGSDPYGQPPTAICEVGTDGSGFRVVWTPEQGGQGATGRADVALHHPDYFEDGSIAFEADWNGEQIWRIAGDGPPQVISSQYSNDNSPCVLNNNCVISLWLERPGGGGNHEIKVMDGAGGNFGMVRTDIDVGDIGISCAR